MFNRFPTLAPLLICFVLPRPQVVEDCYNNQTGQIWVQTVKGKVIRLDD